MSNKMLKNQWSIDSNDLNYKNNFLSISGMSNKAASSLVNKDLFFPTVYNLLIDYKQFPSISSIKQKHAAFNLIPGRQCKYKLSFSLFNNSVLLPQIIISLNSNNKNHFNFGMVKPFYGGHVQFYFNSSFSASYFLLPIS